MLVLDHERAFHVLAVRVLCVLGAVHLAVAREQQLLRVGAPIVMHRHIDMLRQLLRRGDCELVEALLKRTGTICVGAIIADNKQVARHTYGVQQLVPRATSRVLPTTMR